MKKVLLSVLVGAACASTAAIADNRNDNTGWYGGLKGGVSLMHSGTGLTGKSINKGVGATGAVFGYDFYNATGAPIRAELDYTYRGKLKSGDARIRMQTVMLNAAYDFHNSSKFTPYITAGLGYANVEVTNPVWVATTPEPGDGDTHPLPKPPSPGDKPDENPGDKPDEKDPKPDPDKIAVGMWENLSDKAKKDLWNSLSPEGKDRLGNILVKHGKLPKSFRLSDQELYDWWKTVTPEQREHAWNALEYKEKRVLHNMGIGNPSNGSGGNIGTQPSVPGDGSWNTGGEMPLPGVPGEDITAKMWKKLSPEGQRELWGKLKGAAKDRLGDILNKNGIALPTYDKLSPAEYKKWWDSVAAEHQLKTWANLSSAEKLRMIGSGVVPPKSDVGNLPGQIEDHLGNIRSDKIAADMWKRLSDKGKMDLWNKLNPEGKQRMGDILAKHGVQQPLPKPPIDIDMRPNIGVDEGPMRAMNSGNDLLTKEEKNRKDYTWIVGNGSDSGKEITSGAWESDGMDKSFPDHLAVDQGEMKNRGPAEDDFTSLIGKTIDEEHFGKQGKHMYVRGDGGSKDISMDAIDMGFSNGHSLSFGGFGKSSYQHNASYTERNGLAQAYSLASLAQADQQPKGEWIMQTTKSNNLAWGLGAGVRYEATDRVNIDLSYRYVDAGNVKMGGTSKKVRVNTNDFMLGINYNF